MNEQLLASAASINETAAAHPRAVRRPRHSFAIGLALVLDGLILLVVAGACVLFPITILRAFSEEKLWSPLPVAINFTRLLGVWTAGIALACLTAVQLASETMRTSLAAVILLCAVGSICADVFQTGQWSEVLATVGMDVHAAVCLFLVLANMLGLVSAIVQHVRAPSAKAKVTTVAVDAGSVAPAAIGDAGAAAAAGGTANTGRRRLLSLARPQRWIILAGCIALLVRPPLPALLLLVCFYSVFLCINASAVTGAIAVLARSAAFRERDDWCVDKRRHERRLV